MTRSEYIQQFNTVHGLLTGLKYSNLESLETQLQELLMIDVSDINKEIKLTGIVFQIRYMDIEVSLLLKTETSNLILSNKFDVWSESEEIVCTI